MPQKPRTLVELYRALLIDNEPTTLVLETEVAAALHGAIHGVETMYFYINGQGFLRTDEEIIPAPKVLSSVDAVIGLNFKINPGLFIKLSHDAANVAGMARNTTAQMLIPIVATMVKVKLPDYTFGEG